MACLDKILHKQHNVSKSLRAQDQDQEQDRAEERQTLKKSLPCTGTDVLAKARCSEDSKHAGDEKGALGQKCFSIPINILPRFSHVPDYFGLYFWTRFTALLSLNHMHDVRIF